MIETSRICLLSLSFFLLLIGRSAPIYKVLSIDYSSALEMLNKVYEKMCFDDLDFRNDLKVGPRDGHVSFIYLLYSYIFVFQFVYCRVTAYIIIFTSFWPFKCRRRVGWGVEREGRGVM